MFFSYLPFIFVCFHIGLIPLRHVQATTKEEGIENKTKEHIAPRPILCCCVTIRESTCSCDVI